MKTESVRERFHRAFVFLFLILCFFCANLSGPGSGVTSEKQSVTPYPNTPLKVVETYVRLDSEGARAGLTPGGWDDIREYVLWEDEPGWDGAYLFAGYTIKEMSRQADEAVVLVTYRVVGDFGGDYTFTRGKWNEVTAFLLKRIDGRWRIDTPQTPPFLSIDTMIRYLERTGHDSGYPDKVRKIVNELRRIKKGR
jgi:hypothetical protein